MPINRSESIQIIGSKLFGLFICIGLILLGKPQIALAAPACEVPGSGDWIVRSSCDLIQNATAPRNISVRNGATLRVSNGSVLTIDFPKFNLRVANDSRVLVAPRGKIWSAQESFQDGNGSGGSGESGKLSGNPRWLRLSGNPFLIIDFGLIIDGQPQVTLPVDYLPDYLPIQDGEIIVPDNFCGFNIRKADAFFWQNQNNQVVTRFPYNAVESVASLGSNDFLGGIQFTGPIGKCAGKDDPWQFFQPLTQTGKDSPIPGLKLVFQLSQGSEIRFLNFNIRPKDPSNSKKNLLKVEDLFSDKEFDKMEKMLKAFLKSTKIDKGYCSIDKYLRKICEKDSSSKKCLVSDDFVSPC